MGSVLAVGLAFTSIQAQIPGRNVNMVSGTTYPFGDPFLQRQNEPSIAASTRNPLHLLGGSNDYRTVDLPFPPDGDEETGDAWLGLYKSRDGGQRWTSSLLPGYPQDQSPAGLASPLKLYQAGADPVVRAGTHGLIYYNGLAFDRGENGKSGIFVARFIDNNNSENGDPFAYYGTSMVAQSTGAKFFDKPWMVVDMARSDAQMCTFTANSFIQTAQATKGKAKKDKKDKGKGGPPVVPGTQRIPAGSVYVSYSSITGEGTSLKSEILLTRSTDCGATWSAPIKVSRPEDGINQGSTLTIDPKTGAVYIAWRRFSPFVSAQNPNPPNDDAIMVARLPYGGKKTDPPGKAFGFPKSKERRTLHQLEKIFEHHGKKEPKATKSEEAAELAEFDQGGSIFTFRSNAYPTIASDNTGRVYIAFTHRGFPTATSGTEGARILMLTTKDGKTFTQPNAVDDDAQLGHQLMPSLAFAGGKLMLIYYDLRETKSNFHGKFVTDQFSNTGKRQTIDIRAAMASPGDFPQFGGSAKVSDYLTGINPNTGLLQTLQANPPNLPMFKQGTTPFMGDYIDVAAAPAFVPIGAGKWAFNTATTTHTPVFHAAWTDNRDVRPPVGGDWTKYTPAVSSLSPAGRPSLLDGLTAVPPCDNGNAGSRNQNVYSARITGGLLAGSPGNAKPLSTQLQRGFVVFAQNATAELRRFRMTIRNQPVGGKASFDQFAATPITMLEMNVPPRSTASRTVYATSSDPNATIIVDVTEITPPVNGQPVSLGLGSTVYLNPDPENPDVENPDPENGTVSSENIANKEVYNPDVENPDVENPDVENNVLNIHLSNPDVENPDVENPDPENPDVENVLVANPDVENLTVSNPDVENPDVENPDVENPDVENPDVENGAVADIMWQVSNVGNTTGGFNINVFLAQQTVPTGAKTQLILYKTYRTPVTVPNGCQLGFQTRNVLVSNILNPNFILASSGGVPDQNDSSEKNATMWLAPGETGRVTLRVIDDDTSNNLIITKEDGSTVSVDPAFAPITKTTLTISSQGVGTDDKGAGKTDPPLVTPTGSNLFFLQMPGNVSPGLVVAPPVSVQVRDNLTGIPVPGAQVTLTLSTNPGEATLAGNVAVTDAQGIATFPTLTVSTEGIGYVLRASATTGGVAASADSVPFNVLSPVVVALPSVAERTAQLGVSYALSLVAAGGAPPYTWSVLVVADLPPGLSLNPATGVITGTPQVTGAYTITARAQDTNDSFDTQTLCITVLPPPDVVLTTRGIGEAGEFETPLTVEEVVDTLLGDGVSVSNVTLTGAGVGAGTFTGGAGILGFNNGIILSSGKVNDSAGPNDSDGTATVRGEPGDEDLTALSGHDTFDATIIEFDFVPTSTQVSFRYVFGSEEYNEYVASQYNDAFGFFITGPDGTRNWALVPGTETPVTINTINGGIPLGENASNPTLYRNNDLASGAAINIEADGLTVVLTLTATVTPNVSHHMKLAIADAGDSTLDSWVWIGAGSFRAIESCANGLDDDGDGLVDGLDSDCQVCPDLVPEPEPEPVVVDVPATAGGQANLNNPPSGTDPTEQFLAPGLAAFSLITRIGGGPWQFVGVGPTLLQAGVEGGLLEFAMNDNWHDDTGLS